jgi:hypothetical protein
MPTDQKESTDGKKKEILPIDMFQTFSILRTFFPDDFDLNQINNDIQEGKKTQTLDHRSICDLKAAADTRNVYVDDDTKFIDKLQKAYESNNITDLILFENINKAKEYIRKAVVFSLRILGKSRYDVKSLLKNIIKNTVFTNVQINQQINQQNTRNAQLLQRSMTLNEQTKQNNNTFSRSISSLNGGAKDDELNRYLKECLCHFYKNA